MFNLKKIKNYQEYDMEVERPRRRRAISKWKKKYNRFNPKMKKTKE